MANDDATPLPDPTHLQAENHNLRQRVAIAERDLAQAKSDDEAKRARIAAWQVAFGLRDGDDPKDRVRATIADLDAKTKRVSALQAALAMGDGDDPERTAAALRTPETAKAGTLPPWGQLLLLTQLAKHHPLMGQQYAGTPDVLQEPNGDRWTALRQETFHEDGTVGHVVVVQRLPDTFRYDEARSQKLHYEGELATALRARGTAERATAQSLAPNSMAAARSRLEEAAARIEEIRAALRDLEPRLVAPEATEWRFTMDLDRTRAEE